LFLIISIGTTVIMEKGPTSVFYTKRAFVELSSTGEC
jgi:hypothetical protein